jgi:hypothetical protein
MALDKRQRGGVESEDTLLIFWRRQEPPQRTTLHHPILKIRRHPSDLLATPITTTKNCNTPPDSEKSEDTLRLGSTAARRKSKPSAVKNWMSPDAHFQPALCRPRERCLQIPRTPISLYPERTSEGALGIRLPSGNSTTATLSSSPPTRRPEVNRGLKSAGPPFILPQDPKRAFPVDPPEEPQFWGVLLNGRLVPEAPSLARSGY